MHLKKSSARFRSYSLFDMMEYKKININDLPKYSPWPARLLCSEKWIRDRRTNKENYREYESEKWGPLAKMCRKSDLPLTLSNVNLIEHEMDRNSSDFILCSKNDSMGLYTKENAYNNLVEDLACYFKQLHDFSAIVELGAGYGNVLFRLLAHFPAIKEILAGEFSASGRWLIKAIAETENIPIKVVNCNFNSKPICNEVIPEGALIFTCASVVCVPRLGKEFVNNMLALNPTYVAHFEPFRECETSLISMMRNRYLEVNDYNNNLEYLLSEAEAEGKIAICLKSDQLIRVNPLMAYTLTVWKKT